MVTITGRRAWFLQSRIFGKFDLSGNKKAKFPITLF